MTSQVFSIPEVDLIADLAVMGMLAVLQRPSPMAMHMKAFQVRHFLEEEVWN